MTGFLLKSKFRSGVMYLPTGTLGILAISSTIVAKYIFNLDSYTTATNLATAGSVVFGVGQSTFGLFGTSSPARSTSRYDYASNVSSTYTSTLNNIVGPTGAVGNAAFGVVVRGYQQGTGTNKFTYSDSTVLAGGALSMPSRGIKATGNTVFGIINLYIDIGSGGSGTNNITNKYTYASDVVAAGSDMLGLTTILQGAAVGNGTFGIFSKVGSSSSTNKYTYAGDVVTAATNMIGGSQGTAWGNNTVGIFRFIGSPDATYTYTYVGDTVTSATQYVAGSGVGYATSNGITGVNA